MYFINRYIWWNIRLRIKNKIFRQSNHSLLTLSALSESTHIINFYNFTLIIPIVISLIGEDLYKHFIKINVIIELENRIK